MKYTAEQYVNQFLIPEYNELFSVLQRRYDYDLDMKFFDLCIKIEYILSNELLLESRTLNEWSAFLAS